MKGSLWVGDPREAVSYRPLIFQDSWNELTARSLTGGIGWSNNMVSGTGWVTQVGIMRLPLSFSSPSQYSEAVEERPWFPATCHLAPNNYGLAEVWVDALADKKR